MRYHNITKDDMLNGDGLRVVLWMAGCSHCCYKCQNPVTWDPNGGLAFDEAAKAELFENLGKSTFNKRAFENAISCSQLCSVFHNLCLRIHCRCVEQHIFR